MSHPFWSLWYFQVPNYVLAVFMYTLLARLVLGLLVPAQSTNYIWRWFVRLTDPLLRLVSFITPMTLLVGIVVALAFIWVLVARLALYVLFTRLGMDASAVLPPT